MKVDGVPYRTIWLADDGWRVSIIDQNQLPHAFVSIELETVEDAAHAIKEMMVRGAPLIGATGAYGLALALRQDPSNASLIAAYDLLINTRPTAQNLSWALNSVHQGVGALAENDRAFAAYRRAAEICDSDVEMCRSIGKHGALLLSNLWEEKERPLTLNVLTHCNAGWLATVDWGTALAPIYWASDNGVPIHVWVDETRPRNQGASLTAWELCKYGIPHTVIVDNAGGHLMQRGRVDVVLTGTDRTTACGDVCNKVGTYLKALAAHDNAVPFYVALPSPSIDWSITGGSDQIPIEERDSYEVSHISGQTDDGRIETVRLISEESPALNIAFDVTPAKYVSGLITERGICEASSKGLLRLYPERAT